MSIVLRVSRAPFPPHRTSLPVTARLLRCPRVALTSHRRPAVFVGTHSGMFLAIAAVISAWSRKCRARRLRLRSAVYLRLRPSPPSSLRPVVSVPRRSVVHAITHSPLILARFTHPVGIWI
ncbi:hypothetical protein MKEN_01339300 [Mycena kentingensis (nom. inval.)]|nr:hypothetical protein MKEN_01339300 [Mycena kentingensis (nom. inval.)]